MSKEYPVDFFQRLEEAKGLDSLWGNIQSESWSNCFGLVMFLFFPNMMIRELGLENSQFHYPRQYYSPLIFAEKVNSLPVKVLGQTDARYDLGLAADAHFVTVQHTEAGTHNYFHGAVVDPEDAKRIIHRPRVNTHVEESVKYQHALRPFLQGRPSQNPYRFTYFSLESST